MRDWPRYAEALDMRLAGVSVQHVGDVLGVTEQRASQMIHVAGRRLAHRVFGTPRHTWRWSEDRGCWLRRE